MTKGMKEERFLPPQEGQKKDSCLRRKDK